MLRGWILDSSRGYRLFRRLIKADRSMRVIVDEYLRPTPGIRVLDIGCGNADLAGHLPNAIYLGLDSNPEYIASARQRRIDVIEADVSQLSELGYAPFDVAVGIGLLHHLDDNQVQQLLKACRGVLTPSGRIIFVDPVFHPTQPLIARLLMASDRGKFVRHPDDYLRLSREAFPNVRSTIRHDLLPFPYSHSIVEGSVSVDV